MANWMSYKADIIDYVEQHGGVNNVKAGEVADAVGCTTDTVYKYWNMADADAEPEPDPTTGGEESPDLSDPDGDDLDADDLEGSDPDDEPNDLDLEDDDAETHTCSNCGAEVEYLEKTCSECGKGLRWSAIEE